MNTKLTMRERFDHILAEAIREITELAHEFKLDMPCELPSLPGNSFELMLALIELPHNPKTANESSLGKLLHELIVQWDTVLLNPSMDDGRLDIHRQSLQGVARNALLQRLGELKAENPEFHALAQYPRYVFTEVHS